MTGEQQAKHISPGPLYGVERCRVCIGRILGLARRLVGQDGWSRCHVCVHDGDAEGTSDD
jgi:hypothetical protein